MKKVKFLCVMVIYLVGIIVIGAGNSAGAEEISLRFSMPFQAVEDPGKNSYAFLDYVEKHSNGRVKFQRFPGGTMGSLVEHFELVKEGLADVIASIHNLFLQEIPLHAFPLWTRLDVIDPLVFYHKLEFEIPETSALLKDELEKKNVKLMTYTRGFTVGIVSKKSINAFDDLKGMKIGVMNNTFAKALQSMGYNTVTLRTPDVYEGLSRGMIDARLESVSAAAVLKWNEVADCFMNLRMAVGMAPIMVNLDTWNKLPADIQKVFLDAASYTADFSRTLTDNTEQYLSVWKKSGTFSDADQARVYGVLYKHWKQDAFLNAEKVGNLDGVKIIWKYTDEILGQ